MITYHPDPIVNAGVAADVLAAEVADLKAGYPPRRWACPQCGKSHGRGHFLELGQHRCLWCGYVGEGGVMFDETEEAPVKEPSDKAMAALRRQHAEGRAAADGCYWCGPGVPQQTTDGHGRAVCCACVTRGDNEDAVFHEEEDEEC